VVWILKINLGVEVENNMDWQHDDRTKCWSVLTTLTVREYTEMAAKAHEAQGALSGQRGVLTTTTAKRIRARMVDDLKKVLCFRRSLSAQF
jgi:hypothetical protein